MVCSYKFILVYNYNKGTKEKLYFHVLEKTKLELY